MIYVARVALATELADRLAHLTQDISQQAPEAQQKRANLLWKRAQPRREITSVLHGMAPGRQRCMYCGDNQGTDVDHFEPVSRRPVRAFDWLNHLLACSFCNSRQKQDLFPLDNQGLPLLIDPTVEDPFQHMVLILSIGEYRPTTPKGEATIRILALNRPILAEGRQEARDVVADALRLWQVAHETGDFTAQDRRIRTVLLQPLADVVQAMLRYALSPGADQVFARDRDILPILRHPDLRRRLLSPRG